MRLLVIGKLGNVYQQTVWDDFNSKFEIIECANGSTDEAILSACPDADYISVDAVTPVSERLMASLPSLKMVHSEGVGYNAIDLDGARKHGIIVANCAGMNAHAVAEQAVLLMLGCVKRVCEYDAGVREGHQIEIKEGHMVRADLPELSEMKVGLLGFGSIARETAKMLQPFGCDVCYNARHPLPEEENESLGVTFLPFEELISTCDIVSIHIPLNAETEHMFSDELFSRMKQGSWLINTARGGIVDSKALLRAVSSGQLAGAGLDCVEGEPIQKEDDIFSDPDAAKKIVFSPHIGGITRKSMKKSYAMIWEDIRLVSEGKQPKNRIV